jgi:phytoene dehydrogenase-like protein
MSADPTFYVSVTSQTDKTTAPEGHSALFILVSETIQLFHRRATFSSLLSSIA